VDNKKIYKKKEIKSFLKKNHRLTHDMSLTSLVIVIFKRTYKTFLKVATYLKHKLKEVPT